MRRKLIGIFLCFVLEAGFAQTGTESIRQYVGLISVKDHPDLIAFVDKIKAGFAKNEKKKKPKGQDEKAQETPERTPKDAPYERPRGSGFLFKGPDGHTYVITNWHVIDHAWDYSITFERAMDDKTTYPGLVLVAADEENDLALLAFAPGNSPAREGLSLLGRPVQEGEDVYTAGFPALGRDPIWQLGRGQISNAQVMMRKRPWDDEDETMEGPFIQHTGQTDSGNSGGPLLVADRASPSGFSVAGVNSRSARRRQAANYSIPAGTVRAFVERALRPAANPEAERKKLDERLTVFIKEIKKNNCDIFDWITYRCFLDNVEYAFYRFAPKRRLSGDEFSKAPMSWLNRAVYDLKREFIPRFTGKDDMSVLSVEREDDAYNVVFMIRKKKVSSRWVPEHGVWRIASIGPLNGDRKRIAGAERFYRNQRDIIDGELAEFGDFYTAEAGYVLVMDRGPAVYGAFGIEPAGFRLFFADKDYWQFEVFGRSHFKPLRFGVFSLGANVGFGVGVKKLAPVNDDDWGLRVGLSPGAGIQLTSSLIPGFFAGAAYQYNWYFSKGGDSTNTRHLFTFMAGYRFKM